MSCSVAPPLSHDTANTADHARVNGENKPHVHNGRPWSRTHALIQ